MWKKIEITIIFFALAIMVSACDKEEKQLTTVNSFEKSESNQFFMENVYNSKKYKGRFSPLSEDEDMIERDVYIQVEKIAELKSGVIYKFKIQPVRGVPEERLLLGTFYVQKDKIYKIEYTRENIEKMKEEDKILTGSNIVCQEKEIKDYMKHKEKGLHQYMLVKEDLREYHSYDNKVESGYFETYIWKRHTGLKYYKSGYGAEKNLVELKLLN